MTKISTNNATKLDISARNLDSFLLNIEISDANGSAITFGSDEILIFSIYSSDYEPILLACNKKLQITNPSFITGGDGLNALIVADFLAKYAGNNSAIEELLDYGTNRNPFGDMNLLVNPTHLNEPGGGTGDRKDRLWGGKSSSHYLSKFWDPKYSLSTYPTIGGSIPTFGVSEQLPDANRGGNYIAKGTITGLGPLTIEFKNGDFNIQKGNYKYFLKSLSNTMAYSVTPTGGALGREVSLDCSTWLYGKLKINE